MSDTMVFGSLQGPSIPETEYEKLQLGVQELVIASASTKTSKQGDSINVNFLVTSPQGGKGTGFLRINLRHIPFTIGSETFAPYMDPAFLTTGLSKLETLSNAGFGDVSKQAEKELNRARMALAQVRALKRWQGTLDNNLFDPAAFVKQKVEIQGSIQYIDDNFNSVKLTKDGKYILKLKDYELVDGEPEPKKGSYATLTLKNTEQVSKYFNFGDSKAEVATIFKPKAVNETEEEVAEAIAA